MQRQHYQSYSRRGPPPHRGMSSHRDLHRMNSFPNQQASPSPVSTPPPAPVMDEPDAATAPSNYDQVVRFLSENFSRYTDEYQRHGGSEPRTVYYKEQTPNPRLKEFVPVDLQEFQRRKAQGNS